MSEKFKVLFVLGGSPHYLNKVLNRIHAEPDLDVAVILPFEKSAVIGSGVHQTLEGVNFKVVSLPEYKTWYGKPFFKQFYKTVKEEQPACIVIGWPYFLYLVFNPLLTFRLKRLGIKIISREIPFSVPFGDESFQHFVGRSVEAQKTDLIFRSRIWFMLMKLLRKIYYTFVADYALTYTDEGVDILGSYGLDKSHIKVTYNSPDTDELFQAIQQLPPITYQPYRILHVGRLVQWKRVDLLMDAVKQLSTRYPAVELAIVGAGEEEEALKQHAMTLGLEGQVVFLGAIYDAGRLSEQFLKSHVFVMAGMGGLAINEAMCHAIPIVCSVCDGTEKHLIFDGVNGKYFKPDNLASLTETLDYILSKPELKAQMGAESLKIIKEKINIQSVVNRFVEAFRVINSKK